MFKVASGASSNGSPPEHLMTRSTVTSCTSTEYYGWPEYAFAYLTATITGFNKNLWQHWVVIFDPSAINSGW